jgi:hypothetical protein
LSVSTASAVNVRRSATAGGANAEAAGSGLACQRALASMPIGPGTDAGGSSTRTRPRSPVTTSASGPAPSTVRRPQRMVTPGAGSPSASLARMSTAAGTSSRVVRRPGTASWTTGSPATSMVVASSMVSTSAQPATRSRSAPS